MIRERLKMHNIYMLQSMQRVLQTIKNDKFQPNNISKSCKFLPSNALIRRPILNQSSLQRQEAKELSKDQSVIRATRIYKNSNIRRKRSSSSSNLPKLSQTKQVKIEDSFLQIRLNTNPEEKFSNDQFHHLQQNSNIYSQVLRQDLEERVYYNKMINNLKNLIKEEERQYERMCFRGRKLNHQIESFKERLKQLKGISSQNESQIRQMSYICQLLTHDLEGVRKDNKRVETAIKRQNDSINNLATRIQGGKQLMNAESQYVGMMKFKQQVALKAKDNQILLQRHLQLQRRKLWHEIEGKHI